MLDRFDGELNEKEILEIQKAAEKLLAGMEGISDALRGHLSIRDCKKAMEYITKRCDKLLEKLRSTSR